MESKRFRVPGHHGTETSWTTLPMLIATRHERRITAISSAVSGGAALVLLGGAELVAYLKRTAGTTGFLLEPLLLGLFGMVCASGAVTAARMESYAHDTLYAIAGEQATSRFQLSLKRQDAKVALGLFFAAPIVFAISRGLLALVKDDPEAAPYALFFMAVASAMMLVAIAYSSQMAVYEIGSITSMQLNTKAFCLMKGQKGRAVTDAIVFGVVSLVVFVAAWVVIQLMLGGKL